VSRLIAVLGLLPGRKSKRHPERRAYVHGINGVKTLTRYFVNTIMILFPATFVLQKSTEEVHL
jgi:hypothetical protein